MLSNLPTMDQAYSTSPQNLSRYCCIISIDIAYVCLYTYISIDNEIRIQTPNRFHHIWMYVVIVGPSGIYIPTYIRVGTYCIFNSCITLFVFENLITRYSVYFESVLIAKKMCGFRNCYVTLTLNMYLPTNSCYSFIIRAITMRLLIV